MQELDQHDFILLNDFVGQNWSSFLAFLEDHDIAEPEAVELSDRLEKATHNS